MSRLDRKHRNKERARAGMRDRWTEDTNERNALALAGKVVVSNAWPTLKGHADLPDLLNQTKYVDMPTSAARSSMYNNLKARLARIWRELKDADAEK